MDEDVEASLGRQDVGDDLVGHRGVGQVGHDGAFERPPVLLEPVETHDAMPRRREDLAHRAAHPSRAPGDEGDSRRGHGCTSLSRWNGPTPDGAGPMRTPVSRRCLAGRCVRIQRADVVLGHGLVLGEEVLLDRLPVQEVDDGRNEDRRRTAPGSRPCRRASSGCRRSPSTRSGRRPGRRAEAPPRDPRCGRRRRRRATCRRSG